MTRDQTKTNQGGAQGEDKEEKPAPRYVVSSEVAVARGRSLALLMATRRCYTCQQADEEEPSLSSDADLFLERIVEHCGQTSDYLLPDIPLKEAIFRTILARRNEPTTPEEISQLFSEQWAMAPYPREVSPGVIQRLLDHSESYCIVKVAEPEPAETSEPEESSEEPPGESPS